MKNVIIIFCLLAMGGLPMMAQMELKENQFEGYVVKADGSKMEGIVEIKNIKQPWSFQETILFFDKSLLDNEKVKKKEKTECKPGEYIEYGIQDKRYGLVSYTNMNQASGGTTTTAMSVMKATTQNKFFAEIYREGKVSLYRFYNSPPDFWVTSGDAQAQEMESFIRDCKENFDILIEKEGEKAKAFGGITVKKFFKDCDFVVQKYEDKKYTKKPIRGLKSALSSESLRGDALANAAMEMITDYESECAK